VSLTKKKSFETPTLEVSSDQTRFICFFVEKSEILAIRVDETAKDQTDW
jgi:hypothetical protein